MDDFQPISSRFFAGLAAAAVVVVGLIALWWPILLDAYDQWGFQIACGRGFSVDLSQAAAADSGGNYVDQCQSATTIRRIWAIPAVIAGSLVLCGLILNWWHSYGQPTGIRRVAASSTKADSDGQASRC